MYIRKKYLLIVIIAKRYLLTSLGIDMSGKCGFFSWWVEPYPFHSVTTIRSSFFFFLFAVKELCNNTTRVTFCYRFVSLITVGIIKYSVPDVPEWMTGPPIISFNSSTRSTYLCQTTFSFLSCHASICN